MAQRITYQIGFTADTTQLKASFNEIVSQLQKLGLNPSMVPSLQQASTAALDLARHLQSAVDVKTGKLDLRVFNDSLKNSGKTLEFYYKQLSLIGPEGRDAFLDVARSIALAEMPAKRVNKTLNDLWITMKNTMRWQITSSALNGFISSLETAYGYTKDLDRSLNDIRIVSGKSAEEMRNFAKYANEAAKALSSTTVDYTDASLIYYQQGLEGQDVIDRANTTIKMANVTGTAAAEVSDQLTAVWNNFHDGSESIEHYADVMVALGAATASSSDEIAEGIEQFAAVSSTVGLSYEYATTALATLTSETRQSANVVGTALRTLFVRVQGLLQDEEQEDGTTLNKYSRALERVGIDIKDQNGELKAMDDILNEMGAKWDTLSKSQQVALAQTVAGVRQYTQLISLMDNWDVFQTNLQTAYASEGALQEQANIYAESWAAARDRVRASAEDIYDSIINPELFIALDDYFTPILDGTANVIDAMGGLSGLLSATALLMTQVYGDKISQSIRDMATSIGVVTNQEQLRAKALQDQAAELTNTINIGEDLTDEEKVILKTRLESIKVQGEANVTLESLNEKQQEILKADLAHLDALRLQTEEYAKQVQEQKSLIPEQRNSLQKSVVDNKDFSRENLEKDFSNVFRGLPTKIKGTQQPNLENIKIREWVTEIQDLGKKSKTTETLVNNLFKKLNDISNSRVKFQTIANLEQLDLPIEEIDELKRKLLNLDETADSLTIDEEFKKALVELEKLNYQSRLLKNILGKYVPDGQMDVYVANIQKLAKAEADLEAKTEESNKQSKKIIESLEKGSYATRDWADNIVKVGEGLSQLSLAISAIQSIGNVFNDADMSNSERLITLLTNFSMLMPTVVSAMKALNLVTKTSIALEGTSIVVKNAGIMTTLAKAAANKILTKAETDVARSIALTNANIAVSLITLLPYIAAIAALGGVVYGLVQAYHADANAAKEASESIELLTTQYENANNRAEELKNTISNWEQSIQSIGNLTRGTEEYSEALESANIKAKELIETYGLFDKWHYENGLIIIDEEELDRIQNQASLEALNSSAALNQGKIYSNQANLRSQFTNTKRNLGMVAGLDEARELTDAELTGLVKELNKYKDTPIEDEELILAFKEIVPSLRLTIDEIDDFKTSLIKLSQTTEEVASANKFYAQEILKTNILGNASTEFSETFGFRSDAALQALSAIMEQQKLENGLTVGEALAKDIPSGLYANNFNLGQYIGYDINSDEELGQLYAERVLGRSDLIYEGGIGKSNFRDSSTGELIYNQSISDDYIRRMLAQEFKTEEVLKQVEGQNKTKEKLLVKIIEGAENLGKELGDIDVAGAILDGLSNGDFDEFDVSTLFSQLSPENWETLQSMDSDQLEALLGLSKEEFEQLGIEDYQAWLAGFTSGDYDPTEYYRDQIEKSTKTSSSIGEILNRYQYDEALTEDQFAFLDSLGEKYKNFDQVRNLGGHAYLNLLREIQEAEESNIQNSLEGLRKTQQAKVDELESELKSLQDQKESRSWDPTIDLQIAAKTEEFDQAMVDLLDTEYQIDVAIKTDFESDVAQAFGLADEIDRIREYIADGLEITYDEAQSIIAAGYGAMLQNAEETANNTIKLHKETTNAFIDSKQSELEADRQSKINQLELEKQVLISKRDSIDKGLAALQTGLDSQSAAVKAEALATAASYKMEADAKKISVDEQADAADQSNEEIAKDAEALVSALGLMHETDAENAQQAYDDAETAANQSAESQISALNQVQLAAVRAAEAIRGQRADYDPVSFKASNNTKVGATGSKEASNSYKVTESDVQINTDKILEAANNDIETLDAAIEQAKAQLEISRNQIEAQIGAADAGIAALKSANLSLDKTQTQLGKGKDNKGKAYDAEEEKTLEDIADRYHEINRELERQDELLDDIDNNIERTYGADKLKNYDKKIKELNKQQENYNKKLEEAQEYLTQDTSNMQSLFENTLTLDENGEIDNYDAVLQWVIDQYNHNFLLGYNEFLAEYSKLTKDEQELRQTEYDSWQTKKEAAEATYDARLAALKQYEDTLDTIQEIKNSIEETARQIEDEKLNKIEHRLQVVIDLKEMKDAVRELTIKIAESFGDALTHGMEVAILDWEGAQANMDMLKEYEQTFGEYKDALAAATDATDIDRITGNLKNLQGQAIGTAEALLEWIESIETLLPDAIDAAAERFSLFTNQLDHNESVLNTIKELYALQGVTYKTLEEFNKLQRVSREKMDAQIVQAQLQKEWFEGARRELLEAEQALEGVAETDAAYDTLKNNRDALLAEYNQAQEAMLTSAQAAMETAQEMYNEALEKSVYDFGQIVSGGIGLDLLQEKYDHFIDTEERYLDKVNTAYEIESWYRKLQADIDKETSATRQNNLKYLQEEIDMRAEGGKLSEYDLEILEAKYNLLQAQMALEDAQNAKNEIRMVRDEQGNWNYQYTADQGVIDDAEQNLADARNEWYNIAKDQAMETTGDIIATWQECSDRIKEIYSDLTLTDEERTAKATEIYQYYKDKILDLEEAKNVALKDMTEAGSEEIVNVWQDNSDQIADIMGDTSDYMNEFDEDFAALMKDMTYNSDEFGKDLEEMLNNAQNNFNEYDKTVSEVADNTGTSMDDLSGYIDKVSESTDDCRDAGLDAADAMWQELSATQDLAQGYADLVDSVYEYIYALRDLAAQMGQTVENNSGMGKGESTSINKGYDPNTDYAALIEQGLANGWLEYDDENYNKLFNQREDKINNDKNYNGLKGDAADAYFSGIKDSSDVSYWGSQQFKTEQEWRDKLNQLQKFDTGGYTGIFDDGKLAFLHEKELVLNQKDTENILAAVAAVRTIGPEVFAAIERALDGEALAAMSLMSNKVNGNANIGTISDVIEQHVTIEHVEFPNATDRNEIQEAFESLVNDASQWAHRRKS